MQFSDRLNRTRVLMLAFDIGLGTAWKLIQACEAAGMIDVAIREVGALVGEDVAFARLCSGVGSMGADTALANLKALAR